jgi:hypothetical protein
MEDGGQKAMQAVEERRKKRKQAEVQETLDDIQKRISLALDEYEFTRKPSIPSSEKEESDTITIEDPSLLFDVLTDVKKRQKYKKQSTVVVVEYEDRIDERTQILHQIEEFFAESQSGGAQKLLEEIASEEIDLTDATASIEDALDVAKKASERLSSLQSEMIRLLSMNAQFPDTKKGRKKMEKALLKAQEEVLELTDNLVNTAADLKLAEERSTDLKKKLDSKTSEISKLKKEADKVKQLTSANSSLQRDCENLKSVLQKTRGEMESLKKAKEPPKPPPPQPVVDKSREVELEAKVAALAKELESGVAARQDLEERLKAADSQHESEMKKLQENFESEMQEMREKFEDQIKSLAEIDEPFEDDEDNIDADLHEEELPPFEPLTQPDKLEGPESVEEHTNTEEECIPPPEDPKEEPPPPQNDVQPLAAHIVATPPHVPSPLKSDSGQSQKSSTNSPIPTMNALTIRQMETYTREQIEKLKKELADNDRKWKEEVAETRSRSKKAMTAVKAQLVEAQNKHSQEADIFKKDLEEKRTVIDNLESRNKILESELQTAKEERDRVNGKYEQSMEHLSEVKVAMSNLQDLMASLESQPDVVPAEVRDLISRSIQWSTPPISRPPTTLPVVDDITQCTATPHGPTPQPELHPLEAESVVSVESTKHTSVAHSLPVSVTPGQQPSRTSLRHFVKSSTTHTPSPPVPVPMSPVPVTTPPIAHGPVSLHDSSFRRSLVLSSPTGQEEVGLLSNTQPIRRQQGHMSVTPAVVQLSADHPIVKEWTKAYNSVLLFKDHLTDIIIEHFSEDLVSVLMDIDKLDFSADGEVQGQITQMRCSLALLLHQMEQVLQEALSQAAAVHSRGEPEGSMEESAHVMRENSELKVTVQGLEEQLATKEKSHKLEIKRSQEAISQLESTVMGLQKEIALLRRTAKEHGADREEMIMFTRLDLERNERNLNKALRQGTISPNDVTDLKRNMSDYIELQADKFAHLTKGIQQKALQNTLLSSLEDVNQSELSQVRKEKAKELQEKKRVRWSMEMNTLTLKREKLARMLTVKLSEVETTSGVFLIKPIVHNSPPALHTPIITPIHKPLPQRFTLVLPRRHSKPAALPSQPDVKVVRIVSKSCSNNENEPKHPKMKLIEKILLQSKIRDKERLDGEEVKLARSPPLLKKTRKGVGEKQWSVSLSRSPLSPPLAHPTFPKLFEMDVCPKQSLPSRTVHSPREKPSPTTLPPIRLPA